MAAEVGERAPDFSLPATTAEKVSLNDFLGKQHVVLTFHVADFTGNEERG